MSKVTGKRAATKEMMKNYITLFNQGKKPADIAKMYGLSVKTVYNHLDEIAIEHNVSSASLRPPKTVSTPKSNPSKEEKLDYDAFIANYNKVMEALEEMIRLVQESQDISSGEFKE